MSRAVVDQAGFRVVIIGLAVSLFLGLAIRSQISDSRLKIYLDKAVSRLETDFYVDYESAKIQLSNWGLPLPTLTLLNIRLSPKSVVCQSSQIYISQLDVPISIFTILGVSKTIPKIRIKDIELRLSDIDKCSGSKSITENSNSTNQVSKSVSPEANIKNIFSNNTKAELKEIYVEKLKIVLSQKPEQPLLFKQLNFDLIYNQNKLSEVHLKSKLSALKDAKSDVYYLNSSFVGIFKSLNNNDVEIISNINGQLLDGDAQFFIHTLAGSKKISYELALEHVSAKVLAPLLPDALRDKFFNLEKTPISVSLVNTGELDFNTSTASLNSKFKKVQINIDSGVVKINELQIASNDSVLKIGPFTMTVDALPITKIKNLNQFKQQIDSFESLGLLTGELDFKNEQLYNFKGQLKNIKAVFANRGRRDLQNIESINLSILRKNNLIDLNADNFTIDNVKADANFDAQLEVSSSNISAQFKIMGVVLNNKVWEQFTFVEQSPKVTLEWRYKKQQSEQHKIDIYVNQVALPDLKLTDLTIHMNQVTGSSSDSLTAVVKPLKIESEAGFLENKFISEFLNTKYGFNLNKLNSTKTTLSITGVNWKNLNFNLESYYPNDTNIKSVARMQMYGQVNYETGVKAAIEINNKNKKFKFELLRTKDSEIYITPK